MEPNMIQKNSLFLSPKKWKFVELITSSDLPKWKQFRAIGISKRTYYRWLRAPEIQEVLHKIYEENIKKLKDKAREQRKRDSEDIKEFEETCEFRPPEGSTPPNSRENFEDLMEKEIPGRRELPKRLGVNPRGRGEPSVRYGSPPYPDGI